MLTGFVVGWMESANHETPALAPFYTKMSLVKKAGEGYGDANMRFFLLDPQGEPVHTWVGYNKNDLAKGIAKLKAPPPPVQDAKITLTLPDLCAPSADPRFPAGLRLFVRAKGASGSSGSGLTIVQPVPMTVQEWKALSFPEQRKQIDADHFRASLTEIFPAAIRAVSTPRAPGSATKASGKLQFEPAGSDEKFRYALLRGPVNLFYKPTSGNRASETEPKFSGTFQAVVMYGLTTPEVHSLRAVIEGDYMYMPKNTFRMTTTIESRPN